MSAQWVWQDYDWSHSVTQMLQQLGWATLEQRRTEASLDFLYKIVNEKVAVGRKEHLERPSTPTRGNHNKQFRTIWANSDAYKFSFFPRTILVWNNLNNDIVNSASLKQFEAQLKDNTFN